MKKLRRTVNDGPDIPQAETTIQVKFRWPAELRDQLAAVAEGRGVSANIAGRALMEWALYNVPAATGPTKRKKK